MNNALDGRTYVSAESKSGSENDANAIPMEERFSCIYTWGKCIDILNWIDDNYMLRDPATGLREPPMPMLLTYFLEQISAINAYKKEAEEKSIWGSDTAVDCSQDRLAEQLSMVAEIFPELEGTEKRHFSIPNAKSPSLAWQGVQYEVLCDKKPLHISECS